ncbi:glycosyltransferase [Glutamicibacter arilaitensis]|uniref:glycosyltransferase n=1 Tax=Glutamicibacter arilaitensis TaxID=256701 RepID=UPI003FD1D9DE
MPNKNSAVLPAVIQVMDSLGKNRGGLTRAVFDRFRLLSEGRRAVVVTVANQHDVRTVFDELKKNGSLPAHAELLSYYEDQRSTSRRILPRVSMLHEAWENGTPFLGAQEQTAHGSMIRYFQDGSFVGLVYRDSRGELRHVDKHDKNRPWVREYRDTCIGGQVALREYYDEANKPRFRVYIDSEQRAYLSTWVNPDGYEYRTIEHLASESVQHGDTRAANAAWLARKLEAIKPAVVYTDEPRTTFALAIDSPQVSHVTSIHTTHYQNNKDNAQGIKHWAKFYDQFRNNIDWLVFFTETQRQDFIGDTNFPVGKTVVVPHAAPLNEVAEMPPVRRDPNLLVTVSRLADDKRIDDAIRAFAKLKNSFSNARYEVWGGGPASDKLKNLVKELGLEDRVTIAGHTSDPLSKFAKASASVITSRYEGFGLVITESMACGAPVIAYDVIYGPRDVINPSNGALVPDGNIDSLAEAMSKYLTGSDDIDRTPILETAFKYTVERWATGWSSTLITAEGV